MHALVTGSGGFVGSYLVRRLLSQDYSVTAMIRRRSDSYIPSHLLEMRDIYSGKIAIVKGDITNYHDVRSIFNDAMPDVVFHLASQSFVPDSVKNPDYTHQVNTGGTLNVLEAIRWGDIKSRMLYVSSSEVYGFQWPDELPLYEHSKTNPQSPYASAKLYGEYLCRNYKENYGIPVVISRAFNHEGPGRGHHFVTSSIIRQMVMIKNGEKKELHIGDITPTRDWSHVSDVVNAYIMLGEIGVPGETYVIGSGIETSIAEFIRRVQFLLSVSEPRYIKDESLVRKADVPRLRANPKKMKDLGWTPQYNLDDVIIEMIAYYNGMTPKQRMDLEPVRYKTQGPEGIPLNIGISGQVIGDFRSDLDAQMRPV